MLLLDERGRYGRHRMNIYSSIGVHVGYFIVFLVKLSLNCDSGGFHLVHMKFVSRRNTT